MANNHARVQIRRFTKEILVASLKPSENYDIFSSRKSAVNHDPGTTLIDMQILNDQVRQDEVLCVDDGQPDIHVASLYVRIQKSGPEDDIDDLLDSEAAKVEQALLMHNWEGLLEEPPELIQTNFSSASEGGVVLASLSLRFDMEYRIYQHDPYTIIA